MTTLPVKTWANVEQRVLYSYGPMTHEPGTTVDITFQAEVMNDLPYRVSVGRKIIRASSPTETSGMVVSPANNTSVTPSQRYEIMVHRGSYEYRGSASTEYYYNAVAYAVASSPRSNDTVAVRQGYGALTVQEH